MFCLQMKTKNSELEHESNSFGFGYVRTNRIRPEYSNNTIDKIGEMSRDAAVLKSNPVASQICLDKMAK